MTSVSARFPVTALKHVVSLRHSPINGDHVDRPYVGLENVEPWTGRFLGQPTPTDNDEPGDTARSSVGKVFEPDDVLFGKLRPYLAKAWIADFPGRSTTEFLVMRPLNIERRFLRYALVSRNFVDAVDAATSGSRMPRAEWGDIGRLPVPLPEPGLQCAIADYLDVETARINSSIAAKQRLLRLLLERRSAVVARSVTGGSDDNVPSKIAKVDRLHEIPAHWDIVRIRFLAARIEQGWSPPAENREPRADEWGVLKLNAVSQGQFDESAAKALPLNVDPLLDLEIRHGDLLITRSNTPSLVGDACFVSSPRPRLMLCDLIYRLTPLPDVIDARFLVYFLTTPVGRRQIEMDARGTSASMVKISKEHIKDWRVPVPPIDEQRRIVAHLIHKTTAIDRVVSTTARSVDVLKERRSTVIDSAVTGLLDVKRAT